jgi:hypothetical protein
VPGALVWVAANDDSAVAVCMVKAAEETTADLLVAASSCMKWA